MQRRMIYRCTYQGLFDNCTGVAVGCDLHIRAGGWYRYGYHLNFWSLTKYKFVRTYFTDFMSIGFIHFILYSVICIFSQQVKQHNLHSCCRDVIDRSHGNESVFEIRIFEIICVRVIFPLEIFSSRNYFSLR